MENVYNINLAHSNLTEKTFKSTKIISQISMPTMIVFSKKIQNSKPILFLEQEWQPKGRFLPPNQLHLQVFLFPIGALIPQISGSQLALPHGPQVN